MLDHGIVNAVELEREEQEMRRGGGQPLGDVAVELRNRGIDAVAGMDEAGIGAEPAGEIVDRLIALHGPREPFSAIFSRCVFGKLALVVGLKRDAFGVHFGEIVRHFGRIDAGIEVGQIPFRQFAGFAGDLGAFGSRFGFGRLAACGIGARGHCDGNL